MNLLRYQAELHRGKVGLSRLPAGFTLLDGHRPARFVGMLMVAGADPQLPRVVCPGRSTVAGRRHLNSRHICAHQPAHSPSSLLTMIGFEPTPYGYNPARLASYPLVTVARQTVPNVCTHLVNTLDGAELVGIEPTPSGSKIPDTLPLSYSSH